jgi:hypothetical protein
MPNEWENMNPVGRLKNVSITDIQNAISETLSKLGNHADRDRGELLVSIKTMEFNSYYNGLKVAFNVDWVTNSKTLATEAKAKSA